MIDENGQIIRFYPLRRKIDDPVENFHRIRTLWPKEKKGWEVPEIADKMSFDVYKMAGKIMQKNK